MPKKKSWHPSATILHCSLIQGCSMAGGAAEGLKLPQFSPANCSLCFSITKNDQNDQNDQPIAKVPTFQEHQPWVASL